MDTLQVAKKTTLLDRLRRLFGDDRTQAIARSSTFASHPARPDGGVIAGARFSLVGLADVREQLGERWPQLSARVHDLAQAVIQRHLTRGDVFDTHGDDGYVVLFTQLTQVQAEFKCRVIAKEISTKLLGADWAGPSTDGLVFELPETALRAPSFDDALDDAISRGRAVVSAQVGGPPVRARSLVMISADKAAGDPAAGIHVMRPVPRERNASAYTPVWDFGVEALLHFRFNPPPQALGDTSPVMAGAKSDIAALNQVLFDVSRLTQVGRRLPVICPLHLETLLRDSWRAQIARMLRSAPAPLRRLVTLEVIVGAECGPDWIRSLETAWRTLPGRPVARVSLSGPKIPMMSSSLVGHLNLMLPDNFSATKGDLAALGAFVQLAERPGMTCGVLGLRTRPAALAATAAGFRQLSGPAIHADVPSLGHAVHFDLQSLYRDVLPGSA
jgi:hypothetical protein